MPPPGFVIEAFTSAEDLLTALARRDDRWAPFPEDWIYRGQRSAKWGLRPAAHRESTLFGYGVGRLYRLDPTADPIVQVGAEADVVRFFVKEVDRAGLPLPGEPAIRWRELGEVLSSLIRTKNLHDWPSEDIAPVFALAQHHGIPTRLLDWTDRPFVAAYFAAVEAATESSPNRTADPTLAVWAISIARSKAVLMGDLKGQQQPQLRLVRPPRSSNSNLRAQDGVFTLLADTARERRTPCIPPPLDELLSLRLQEIADERGGPMAPLIRKMELPISQAGVLLRLLAQEFVSATQMYPGLGGAVQGLRERALWDLVGHVPGD